jgi:hypothetical protein
MVANGVRGVCLLEHWECIRALNEPLECSRALNDNRHAVTDKDLGKVLLVVLLAYCVLRESTVRKCTLIMYYDKVP